MKIVLEECLTLLYLFHAQVISVIKRKWGQHQLMQGNSVAVGRTTLYTQASVTFDVPSREPRLYDNRCQAPGGKPHKPIAKFKPMKGRADPDVVPESAVCMLPRQLDKGECTGVWPTIGNRFWNGYSFSLHWPPTGHCAIWLDPHHLCLTFLFTCIVTTVCVPGSPWTWSCTANWLRIVVARNSTRLFM